MTPVSERVFRCADLDAARAPVRAVVLDWAGTIVDFGSCAPAATFVEAFGRHGVGITVEEARAPMGKAKREHIAAIAATPRVAEVWRARHSRGFTESDIDAVFRTFLPLQEACVERFSTVIPGAVETVAGLRARGVGIGSSTGYTREIMERVVRCAKAQGLETDVMTCATDFPQGRPWPWMIFENMRRLEVCPPSSVVVVDDTVVGVQAGVNAGAWSVGVAATGNLVGLDVAAYRALSEGERASKIAAARETLARAGAHYVIDSIADLPGVVADIESRAV